MRYRQRLILLFTVVSVLAVAPAYGQTCDPGDLRRAIQQLQDDKARGAAQQALRPCGEPAAKLLAKALSEPQPPIRLAAAQTLGQMGWEAKSAIPI